MSDDQNPYRVADAKGHGWLRNGPQDTYTTYPRTDLHERTYEQLAAERGPLRPVVAMDDSDAAQLSDALAQARRKAMATLLVALNRTATALIAANGTSAALTAGRPGSWEASLLRDHIQWEGERIKTTRVSAVALGVTEVMLRRWTTGPTQVELAEGLPYVLSVAAKKAGGWSKITDQWLINDQHLKRWTACWRDDLPL